MPKTTKPRAATRPAAPRPKRARKPAKTAPAKLKELETKLDAIIAASPARADTETEITSAMPDTLPAPSPPPEPEALLAFDRSQIEPARSSLPRPMRQPVIAGDVDDFGYDPSYDARVRPFFDFLYTRYFRVEQRGVANVPNEGRCMLVANHSGTIPFDGPMLKLAIEREHPAKRLVRWLAEDFVFHFPFLGSFETRIGAVRACQENAERLLKQETLLAVFPEGTKGIGKLFKERYQLQRFGRGGFVRLAMRTQTPIVPVAIVGAEETNPMLARLETLGKPLGIPYVPVTPTFPLLGPLGLLPAPTKWKIVFGEPIVLRDDAESERDEMLVARTAERVRAAIQQLLDAAVRERKSVLFG